MLQRLDLKCKDEHRHGHFVGGKVAAAAFYHVSLVEAIVRGIRDTADAESHGNPPELSKDFACSLTRAGNIKDVPECVDAKVEGQSLADQVTNKRIPFKYADGRTVERSLPWNKAYRDEYTDDTLPTDHIRSAMAIDMK